MRNVGASTPCTVGTSKACTVTCTAAGSSVLALWAGGGGGGYGRRGEHEGAPSGVERECGQCGLDRGGIGSGGIGSSGIHGGIAGLVFG